MDQPHRNGDSARQSSDPLAPPGWSYNPSKWSERIPILIAAVIGFGLAMYLALYQWRIISSVWDPFFASPDPQYANGSERILNSWISSMLPVPDAFLGALGYLADAVTGVIGGKHRWKTMPWIVIIFGIFVGPLGGVSLLLVIIQPVLFHTWCLICMTTALISVLMIGPAMDEFLASLQFLKRIKHEGGSVWPAFWGLSPEGGAPAHSKPAHS